MVSPWGIGCQQLITFLFVCGDSIKLAEANMHFQLHFIQLPLFPLFASKPNLFH
jgi:hypothetical protein